MSRQHGGVALVLAPLLGGVAYAEDEPTIDELRGWAAEPDPCAQASLGYRYFHGIGVPQNYTEAAKWYRAAAEQGDTDAQKWLAAYILDSVFSSGAQTVYVGPQELQALVEAYALAEHGRSARRRPESSATSWPSSDPRAYGGGPTPSAGAVGAYRRQFALIRAVVVAWLR